MKTIVRSAVLFGIESIPVEVHAEVVERDGGWPDLEIVGLRDTAAREAKLRVKAALAHNEIKINRGIRVTIESPEPIDTSASSLDLAIVAAVYAAATGTPTTALTSNVVGSLVAHCCLVGEVSLAGKVRAVRGVLPHAIAATKRGERAIIPAGNAEEIPSKDIKVSTVDDVMHLFAVMHGDREWLPCAPVQFAPRSAMDEVPLAIAPAMADVRRALDASVKSILLIGQPGAGKTMVARRVPHMILPMSPVEALEVARIYSASGLLGNQRPRLDRPLRAPHHTVSTIGLIGGGDVPRPGEVSLAHRGVLFLDEIVEFRMSTLEALASVIKAGEVRLHKNQRWATIPARPEVVIAAANACACGGDPCRCRPDTIERWQTRLTQIEKLLGAKRIIMEPIRLADLMEKSS